MPISDHDDGITRIRVLSGYYEISMQQGGRPAVDRWISRVADIWKLHTRTRQPIPILTIQAKGDQVPLSYAMNQGLKLAREFNDIPRGRTVFMQERTIMTGMLDSFLKLMRLNVEYRYMEYHEQDEATAWLQALGADLTL